MNSDEGLTIRAGEGSGPPARGGDLCFVPAATGEPMPGMTTLVWLTGRQHEVVRMEPSGECFVLGQLVGTDRCVYLAALHFAARCLTLREGWVITHQAGVGEPGGDIKWLSPNHGTARLRITSEGEAFVDGKRETDPHKVFAVLRSWYGAHA